MDVVFAREVACERVVTGKRIAPEVHVPAREEEIVEWRCDSILAPASEENEEILWAEV